MEKKILTKEEARKLPIGGTCIIREQFTAWDDGHHPEIYGKEWLELESRSGILSKDVIISYGYQRCTHLGNGNLRIEWIKIAEALAQ